jgi:hypothetical protein
LCVQSVVFRFLSVVKVQLLRIWLITVDTKIDSSNQLARDISGYTRPSALSSITDRIDRRIPDINQRMTTGDLRAQKLLEMKKKMAMQRLTRIAHCGPQTSDWNEATSTAAFQRSFAKDPELRDDTDIENIVLGIKTCRGLQVGGRTQSASKLSLMARPIVTQHYFFQDLDAHDLADLCK